MTGASYVKLSGVLPPAQAFRHDSQCPSRKRLFPGETSRPRLPSPSTFPKHGFHNLKWDPQIEQKLSIEPQLSSKNATPR
jgi:hypothetical protein